MPRLAVFPIYLQAEAQGRMTDMQELAAIPVPDRKPSAKAMHFLETLSRAHEVYP